MNKLDAFLCELPQSTNGWHCPWFMLIFLLGLNGGAFGLIAFLSYGVWLGLVACVVGFGALSYTTWHRFRKDDTSC